MEGDALLAVQDHGGVDLDLPNDLSHGGEGRDDSVGGKNLGPFALVDVLEFVEGLRAHPQGVEHDILGGPLGVGGIDLDALGFGKRCTFAHGDEALPLASSQDHKRLLDGDAGPNTGGMGAYSPAPVMTNELADEIMRTIIAPTLAGMREEGRTFTGVLYAGLMICRGKPYVLEYNVRFGDPEAEVILPRLQSDWVDLMEAALNKKLTQIHPRWTEQSAVCVVLASKGYPANPQKGDLIEGLEEAEKSAIVYHAGTQEKGGKFTTSGGRVLTVTALGDTLRQAVDRVYSAVGKVHFEGMHYRRDIAKRGLK